MIPACPYFGTVTQAIQWSREQTGTPGTSCVVQELQLKLEGTKHVRSCDCCSLATPGEDILY